MKYLSTIVLLGYLVNHSAEAADSNMGEFIDSTPIIVYKTTYGYYEHNQAVNFQRYLWQNEDVFLAAGDPSPQPSVFAISNQLFASPYKYNRLIPPLGLAQVSNWYDVNVELDLRTGCDLIAESFLDRHGDLLEPEELTEVAIECGCEMVNAWLPCV